MGGLSLLMACFGLIGLNIHFLEKVAEEYSEEGPRLEILMEKILGKNFTFLFNFLVISL